MKKMIVALIALATGASYAAKEQVRWRHNGIYIVNKSEGCLTISWDGNEEDIAPLDKKLIPVTRPNVLINISYHHTTPAYADMPSCQGGAQTSFKTSNNIKLYEIHGGHEEGRAAFNRPATGIHCNIKLHHQRFPAETAIQRYPDLK